MNSLRNKKQRPRDAAQYRDGGPYQLHKREKVPLHDEADLVNFRTDALIRLIKNQDFLENVSLKPFHTAHIAPPSMFPTQSKKAYAEGATDAEIEEMVAKLLSEDLVCGDVRLMRAKQALLERECASLASEKPTSVESEFSVEMQFQRAAVQRLVMFRREKCTFGSLDALERVLNDVLDEYRTRFSKQYTLQQTRFHKHSLPIKDLAPHVDVQQAPPLYNPRLITSSLEMKGDDAQMGQHDIAKQRSGQSFYKAGEFMSDAGFDDFGLMLGDNGMNSRGTSAWASGAPQALDDFLKNDVLSCSSDFYKEEFGGSQGGVSKPSMSADNMVDLNQFLKDGAGYVDGVIDEVNALIDFDQANSAPAANGGEEPFGVDFLNEMGVDLG
ncbi:hypothetical protein METBISCDRAFT_21317 [Metschnikowia bicuspidata]|uniref:Uncharacterized protein n=1 Tax=Metschnikowia bicuspidata TaxID=27322 RepID=A0A4P9ZKF9_9ASCO|nr:hypothetical protein METBISCDRAFT_21317 [Metschnikowia bicuspidata]